MSRRFPILFPKLTASDIDVSIVMKLGAQDSDITIRKADAFFRSHFAPVWQKAPKVCKEAAI